MADELEELYLKWVGQTQTVLPISVGPAGAGGVSYLGRWVAFGPTWPRHRLWMWKKQGLGSRPANISPTFRSQEFQEKSLDKTLSELKNCVVLSTTPTYYSQYLNACLLRSRGFQLLEDKCYRHPGYKDASGYSPEHPGIPDRYHHWEHIWWKVIGEPREIGMPIASNQMHNCGVDSCNGLEQIQAHDKGDRKNYLAVAWLPRGILFPKGWKRFFSGQDYKLGVNFDLIGGVFKSKVQKCDHNFDLKVFDGWEPDFEKWSPA